MVQRKKGAIITLSSAAAFCPMPLLSVYSATKVRNRGPSLIESEANGNNFLLDIPGIPEQRLGHRIR